MRDWVAQQTEAKEQRIAAEKAETRDMQPTSIRLIKSARKCIRPRGWNASSPTHGGTATRASRYWQGRACRGSSSRADRRRHNETVDSDPMMREARDQARSVFQDVQRDHWKGMTTSELAAIQRERGSSAERL